ncbi:hypothetical protein AMTRI_Chr08g209490 [Amborella trichopoda]
MPLSTRSSGSALQFFSLICTIWLQSINGTNSDFPAYSSLLKKHLSISQVQLNYLAAASDAGKLFGWISGLAAKHLPLSLVIFIGSALGLIGYGLQYLLLEHKIYSLSYFQIFFLFMLAGNGICWLNTVCYLVILKNFSHYSGIVLGLSTSYQGLSANIYTALAGAISPRKFSSKTYLLLNSVIPIGLSIVSMPFMRVIEGPVHDIKGKLAVIFIITVATGAYTTVGSIRPEFGYLRPRLYATGLVLLLLSLLLVPLWASLKEVLKEKWCFQREMKVFTVGEEEVGVEERESGSGFGEKSGEERESGGGIREDYGVTKLMSSVDFWLYLGVYFCGATVGLVYLNNLGQIAESRGHTKTSALVSLASSFGFLGRIFSSILDWFSHKNSSRPAYITLFMVPMTGAFFLLLSSSTTCLYMSTAIVGISSGAISSISVSTTSDLFGQKNFGLNHNIVVANIPIGSFLFGYLSAIFYDRKAHVSGRCMGADCFRGTFIIWGSVCSLGTILSFFLYLRTRKHYMRSR